jgi:hypothetical protein
MRVAIALCAAALTAGCVSIPTDGATFGDDPRSYAAARSTVCTREWWSCIGLRSQGGSLRDHVRAADQRQANAENPGPYPAVQPELSDR